MVNFQGSGIRIDDYDLPRIGAQIGVGEDEIHAVLDVEASGSGFDQKGRLKQLFESHRFYAELRKIDPSKLEAAIAQHLAYPEWRPGAYPADSYPRLLQAMAIDETAALKSCSWGLGQILGSNHVAAGYPTVQAMIAAFCAVITSVTVSGNVVTAHNRVVGDAASGCILIGYANLLNVSSNSMTGCGANNIVASSAIEKSIISNNNMSDTITKAATNNGIFYTTNASGARVNNIGNMFQDMSVGYRFATGISIVNIQTLSTLCVIVTNCVVGP